MKPKNNKEITRAYCKFAIYLTTTVLLTTTAFWAFLKSNAKEMECIQQRQATYDKAYTETIDLVRYMEETYNYLSILNKSEYDNTQLVNTISKRKVNMQRIMEKMSKEDCTLYLKLNNDINTIMGVKDSIRILTQKEEMIRQELLRCLDENRQTLRKASLKGVK
ncbi:hypothetical protein [Bacteroides congonensis]